jgi:hypothetical protein
LPVSASIRSAISGAVWWACQSIKLAMIRLLYRLGLTFEYCGSKDSVNRNRAELS